MSLHVLDPGLASRVVDLGRPGTRNLGMPSGGAADRAALVLGNALVGNPAWAPALEVCLKGPVLRASCQLGCVLFGAPLSLGSARQSPTTGTTFTMEPGEELTIGGTDRGMRAYFCVRGGLQGPEILGSFSGLRAIAAGDNIPCMPSSIHQRFLPPKAVATLACDRSTLRVVPGLQADWFDEPAFYHQNFNVTPAVDRMGLRLHGSPLVQKGTGLSNLVAPPPFASAPVRELISEPVCPGAVQVTRDGQCIILGIDGQTIGGYPKVAQVIQADLDHLGQLRPGETVRFEKVELTEAVALFRRRQAFIGAWSLRARVALDGW